MADKQTPTSVPDSMFVLKQALEAMNVAQTELATLKAREAEAQGQFEQAKQYLADAKANTAAGVKKFNTCGDAIVAATAAAHQ